MSYYGPPGYPGARNVIHVQQPGYPPPTVVYAGGAPMYEPGYAAPTVMIPSAMPAYVPGYAAPPVIEIDVGGGYGRRYDDDYDDEYYDDDVVIGASGRVYPAYSYY